jgi:hypothetical protein
MKISFGINPSEPCSQLLKCQEKDERPGWFPGAAAPACLIGPHPESVPGCRAWRDLPRHLAVDGNDVAVEISTVLTVRSPLANAVAASRPSVPAETISRRRLRQIADRSPPRALHVSAFVLLAFAANLHLAILRKPSFLTN